MCGVHIHAVGTDCPPPCCPLWGSGVNQGACPRTSSRSRHWRSCELKYKSSLHIQTSLPRPKITRTYVWNVLALHYIVHSHVLYMNTLVLLLTVKDGNTPLMAAVQENRLEAARLLVMECNCNTNVRNKVRCSILVMSALLCAVQLCVYLCLIISWGEAIMCCLVF